MMKARIVVLTFCHSYQLSTRLTMTVLTDAVITKTLNSYLDNHKYKDRLQKANHKIIEKAIHEAHRNNIDFNDKSSLNSYIEDYCQIQFHSICQTHAKIVPQVFEWNKNSYFPQDIFVYEY